MKTRICALSAALILMLSMSVSALSPLSDTFSPSLSFDGTTAICEIDIWGNSSSDKISVTVKLWHGNTCLKTWTQSDTQYLFFSEEYSNEIEAGERYRMMVSYTIAGKTYPTVSVYATCPG